MYHLSDVDVVSKDSKDRDRRERGSWERMELINLIEQGDISPHFQPIVDLYTGEIFGFEVLSRGAGPFRDPVYMFKTARQLGLSWRLEYACRMKALKKISTLPQQFKDFLFFLNVSPDIFSDPDFKNGFTMGDLLSLGLDYRKIIIEITETTSVDDYSTFEEMIGHYVGEGFRVALDDFGAGHSGLITLVAMTPHYLKIDREIIKDIATNSYKQNLVKAISAFTINVESDIIAEGIETFSELKTVFRLGARYGQGFLLGRPNPEPCFLSEETKKTLHNFIEEYNHRKYAVDISISRLVTRPFTVKWKTMKCEELDSIFRQSPNMDHVVVQEEDRPYRLITRQDFYSVIGGKYGFAIFQRRYIEDVVKTNMLMVDEVVDLRALGRMAMNRKQNELYNPVVIVDTKGALVGTITIKQLLAKAFDTEIRMAAAANPLTQLPGNMIIGVWLEEVLAKSSFTVIYCDLNHFKEYNDTYGFAKGDDMLKLTARILQSHIVNMPPDARLGHIGGDDFIIVSEIPIEDRVLADICNEFDSEKAAYFSKEHLKRGFYKAANRQGEIEDIPLVALSLAVVTDSNFSTCPHPGRLSEIAALLKKKIKSINAHAPKSDYLTDRRVYQL